MRSKKLLAAAVAAITMLIGGLGMALWPSSAGATGSIRKFSGLIRPEAFTVELEVSVHNPHPTATLRPSVVVRDLNGNVIFNQELTVGPHKAMTAYPTCHWACTVEVNMTNAIIQPSIQYYSSLAQQWQHVYSGDFSR